MNTENNTSDIRTTSIDCNDTINEYISKSDWRVKANANGAYSSSGLVANISGKIIANYWLDSIYTKEIGEAHRDGDFYIHDLDVLGPYCCGHDLQRLLNEGFNGVRGKIDSKAPKHLNEALGQMVNYIGVLQSEWAGAQAFSSFDTLLAPYLFRDQLDYTTTKKYVRSFVYGLNMPSRWGFQAPFSNITLDLTVPRSMAENFPTREDDHIFADLAGNEKYEKLAVERGADAIDTMTYKHFLPEMQVLQKALFEVLTEGDKTGQPFTFPIPTVNITEDFDWDSPSSDAIFENAAKVGSPYFQNFIGSQYLRDEKGKLTIRNSEAYSPNDLRSMCCRLQLSKRDIRNNLKKRGGGLFGSDSQTGSIGNVTINLARLGYVYKGDEQSLFNRLDYVMDLAKESLERKRKFIQEMKDGGLYPYTSRWLRTFDTFFSTIGINGMNELIRNFTSDEHDITDEFGQAFAKRILEHIRERMEIYKDETGNLYNLEASPAEGCTHRLARADKAKYPDIIQAGTEEHNYYTNSTQLPVNYTQDIFQVLKLQDDLQCMYTGGTVQHLYMSEQVSSGEACKRIVRKVFENFRLPYISITPTFSVCPKHGRLSGRHDHCPLCDEEILSKYSK